MAQTWTGSIVEMKANIVSGFILNYGINVLILPVLFDPRRPFLSAFEIGCVFTVVSVCRQLFIRRKMDKIKRFQTGDMEHDFSHAVRGAVLLPDGTPNYVHPANAWGESIPVESLGREHA